jgi:hypothetical protein
VTPFNLAGIYRHMKIIFIADCTQNCNRNRIGTYASYCYFQKKIGEFFNFKQETAITFIFTLVALARGYSVLHNWELQNIIMDLVNALPGNSSATRSNTQK